MTTSEESCTFIIPPNITTKSFKHLIFDITQGVMCTWKLPESASIADVNHLADVPTQY